MMFRAYVLALALCLAVPALAQDSPAKEEPAAPETAKPEEPAKAEPAKDETAKPAEAAPAAEAKPVAPKEVSACAKSFEPLADSYKKAYDDMQTWIAQIDSQTAATSDTVSKLQAQIKENETAAATAKAGGDNAKAKDLTKQNKALTTQLNDAKKSLSNARSGFVKEAPGRVKQYETAIEKALDDLKAQTK